MAKPPTYDYRLPDGQRVVHKVFSHMSGVVVDTPDSYSGYKVLVDKDVGHFAEHVYISEDEIITERDYEIRQAERQLENTQNFERRAVKDLTYARENVHKAKEARREAEAGLRKAKALPA